MMTRGKDYTHVLRRRKSWIGERLKEKRRKVSQVGDSQEKANQWRGGVQGSLGERGRRGVKPGLQRTPGGKGQSWERERVDL